MFTIYSKTLSFANERNNMQHVGKTRLVIETTALKIDRANRKCLEFFLSVANDGDQILVQ